MSNDFIEPVYVSGGCNAIPQCIDWYKNGFVCYPVKNSVFIWDPDGKVILTLSYNKATIVSLCWLCETQLVSGSSDGSLIVWTIDFDKLINYENLKGHQSSIISLSGNNSFIVSCSVDSGCKIYYKKESKYTEHSSIDLKSFCFCSKIWNFCNLNLLALAVDAKDNVKLYSIDENGVNYLTGVKGHDDWVRDMDFKILNENEGLLATASQDSTVRLWRLKFSKTEPENDVLSLKSLKVVIGSMTLSITCESVLLGHEDRVYSVQWSSRTNGDYPLLMTGSLDTTIIEWGFDDGVWIEKTRLGELGSINLGFVATRYNFDGSSILAVSYDSAFHKWDFIDNWVQVNTTGGHFEAVNDIAWQNDGKYLLSTSADETTRLHACQNNTWHELSRPQIHGYVMNSITSLPNFLFVSAADEKVARVFKAPANILKFISSICDWDIKIDNSEPSGALVPSLGLSNKAVFKEWSEENKLPSEVTLKCTLWPEVMKLYGHGNEVYTVTASHIGDILATASKATKEIDAQIILWDTNTWDITQKLEGHKLTITQMEFSPNDKYLVSVSRDRTWSLYCKINDKFVLNKKCPSGFHTRIIWACCWSKDSLYFATGSRDGVTVVWNNDGESVVDTKKDTEIVTALDIAPKAINNKYLLAFGYESGLIDLWSFIPYVKDSWDKIYVLKQCHSLTVTRLLFKPETEDDPPNFHLASASLDHSVRIFTVNYKLPQIQA